jgi:hypothetical protein
MAANIAPTGLVRPAFPAASNGGKSSPPATRKNFRNLDNQRSQTDGAIRKKEWRRGSTGCFAVGVFGDVAVRG